MDARVGLRRLPDPGLDDVGEEAGLLERIRSEIRTAGPMPFARFMALALYDQDGGYYRAASARPGRAGDFLTAPELHPIFGASLSSGLREVWQRLGRPDPFVISEPGAGDGALAVAILSAIDDPALRASIRYDPVEVDVRRLDAFRQALQAADLATHLRGPGPSEPVADTTFEGVVLANEVLDALPVHRVRQHGAAMRELAVALDAHGSLLEVEVEPSTPALAARLAEEGIVLADGQTAEICLELRSWLAAASRPLRRGLVLLIDYGAPAPDLYDRRRRPGGTLQAYLRHRVHDDPYVHVGRQDLTAHVDITAVRRSAQALGLTEVGMTSQAEALIGLGIEERWQAVQADPTTTAAAYTSLRGSLQRLLDPAATGGFRVMAFGRDWPADVEPLGLFRYRIPRRSETVGGARGRSGP